MRWLGDESHLLAAEVMALNGGNLPVLVARRPFRKFCRQRAGAPELKECSVSALSVHERCSAAAALVSKPNMHVDKGNIGRHRLWNVV